MTYVFLLASGVGPVSGAAWPTPHDDGPGEWLESSAVQPPVSRVQACRAKDLPFWVNEVLWDVELAGHVTEHRSHVSADRGRLVRRVNSWTPELSAAFAAGCGLRTRDHAVDLLRHEGATAAADRLDECADLEAIAAAGAALAAELSGRPALFAARAAANAMAARAPRTAITAHLTAVVAAEVLQATGNTTDFDTGYLLERRRQADWLASRL